MSDTNATYPLNYIRVLDLSRVLAGPLCAMMLGDLGAEVIKIERPLSGDDTRGWGPPFASDGESAYFRSVNRNKLSVAADLASPADIALLISLISEADVVIENYLPAVLARKGLDADELLKQFPNLIWCTISGFGPDSSRPGYDAVVQAESGWMSITGPAEGPASKVGVALVDVIAGKDAASAILAALVGRAHLSPTSRHLHVSLRTSATAALVNVAQNTLVSGSAPRRWGNAHPNLVPYQLFSASDRPFVLAVGNDAQWQLCASAIGLEPRPEWHTNAGRVSKRSELIDQLEELFSANAADHWIALLSPLGIPCGLVASVPEALAHVKADAITGVEPATGGSVRRPPPRLDEHGERIRAMGWKAFDVTLGSHN